MRPVDGLAWQLAQNRTAKDYPFAGGLVPLLEANAAAVPDHPAVIYENDIETYGAFNSKVNRLAHLLLELGCGRDRLVGLCFDRSLHLPAAVWAVLKAGGAYVPLAVDDPDLRLKELIDDAGPRDHFLRRGDRCEAAAVRQACDRRRRGCGWRGSAGPEPRHRHRRRSSRLHDLHVGIHRAAEGRDGGAWGDPQPDRLDAGSVPLGGKAIASCRKRPIPSMYRSGNSFGPSSPALLW